MKRGGNRLVMAHEDTSGSSADRSVTPSAVGWLVVKLPGYQHIAAGSWQSYFEVPNVGPQFAINLLATPEWQTIEAIEEAGLH